MGQVTVTETTLKGVYLLSTPVFSDSRGTFTKVFNSDFFEAHSLTTQFKESYYSFSKKGVIRGMHFQVPPFSHTKLVYVSNGSITDVVLDLRKDSPTFGKFEKFELSRKNGASIYIAPGLAHGFEAMEDNSCVAYLQTTTHSPEHDHGIKFDSFGMSWNTSNPIMSERDSTFPTLANFESPFI
jgi:dTDP-4-dehydrorhamnose 3,5-epimerase